MFLSDNKKMELEKHYEEVLKDLPKEELVNRLKNVNSCLQASWPSAPTVVDACIIELNQYVKRLSMG